MNITKNYFGTLPDGTKIDIFKLTNSKNMSVDIINFGGIIVSILVPDKDGNIADVALGYPQLEKYIDNDGYLMPWTV